MTQSNDEQLEELTCNLHELYVDLDKAIELTELDSLNSIDVIGRKLRSIKSVEAVLHPLRTQYLESGRPVPPHLKSTTDATISLIKSLMPKLAALEKKIHDSTTRLFPKIQESVRAVRMQDAYQNHTHELR